MPKGASPLVWMLTPLWWAPEAPTLLSIHPHWNLKATILPSEAALGGTWQSHRSSRLKGWILFIPHLPGICWELLPTEGHGLPHLHVFPLSSTGSQPVCLPLWAQAVPFPSGVEEGREPEKAEQSSCSPPPPLCQLKGSNWLTQKALGALHQRVVAPPKQDLLVMFFLPVGKHRRGKIRTDVFKQKYCLTLTWLWAGTRLQAQHLHFCPSVKRNCRVQPCSSSELCCPEMIPPPDDQQNPKSPSFPSCPPLFCSYKLFFFFQYCGSSNYGMVFLTENTFLVWNDSIFKDDSTCSQTFKKPLKPFKWLIQPKNAHLCCHHLVYYLGGLGGSNLGLGSIHLSLYFTRCPSLILQW